MRLMGEQGVKLAMLNGTSEEEVGAVPIELVGYLAPSAT